MRQDTQPFFITKDYSDIPGLQTSSRDTYEVLSSNGYIIIRYEPKIEEFFKRNRFGGKAI